METYESKICQWLAKQFRKFNTIEKTEEGVAIPKDKAEVVQSFKRYVEVLAECLKKCEKGFES